MKSTSPIAAFALAAIFCFSTSLHAAPSAEDAIKYRNLVMDSLTGESLEAARELARAKRYALFTRDAGGNLP